MTVLWMLRLPVLATAGQCPHSIVGAQEQHVRSTPRKETVRHDPRQLVQGGFELCRGGDGEPAHIEDHVAVIRHEALPPLRGAAELHELARYERARKGDHFDR